MKITEGKVQRLVAEELERARVRRRRDNLSEAVFAGKDVSDLLAFARVYRGLSEDAAESFDALMEGDFEDVFVPLNEVRECLTNVHPEIDEAFAEHAAWMKARG